MIDFSKWKIYKVEYLEDRPIDFGRVHFNFALECFEIYLGSKPRTWKGLRFSAKDKPLLREHEKAHCLNLIEGIDREIPSALMVLGDRIQEKKRLIQILECEKKAWKRAFKELKAEKNLNWLEKAQKMLNVYVFQCLK